MLRGRLGDGKCISQRYNYNYICHSRKIYQHSVLLHFDRLAGTLPVILAFLGAKKASTCARKTIRMYILGTSSWNPA
jgi:hypothetical protein